MNRRDFVRNSAGLATVAAWQLSQPSQLLAGNHALFSKMGITASFDNSKALKAAGAQFITENTGRFLMPDQPEEAFDAKLAEFKAKSALPLFACNSFIRPKHLRCVGADATPEQVLDWAAICFRRLAKAGGKYIVFGSSGSRRLRDGWTKEQADEQFIPLLRRMGRLAEVAGVTVALEQLRDQEVNYINHIEEGAEIVRAVDHPNVRLLADFFHMLHVGDTPKDLDKAMDVVVHCEIAEKEGRTVPGINGEDFTPFFKVLKKNGYKGAISIEGRWEIEQLPIGFKTIAEQAKKA